MLLEQPCVAHVPLSNEILHTDEEIRFPYEWL